MSGGLTYRPANRRKRPLWAEFIFALDRWLRRRQGVFEYTHDPECIFRIQLQRLRSEVVLSDGTFGRPGDQVIDLHLWNEQIPAVPVAGPSLAWGRRFNRCSAESLHELARFLMNEPDLLDITIIRARAGLDALHRIAARHEFEAILEPVSLSPWECVHWFGENILYWLLTLACNSGGAWPKTFWRSRLIFGGFGSVLAKPYSSLANNLFASSCDNRRPIISFGTRHLRSSSWPSVNSPSRPCLKSFTGVDASGSPTRATAAKPAQRQSGRNQQLLFGSSVCNPSSGGVQRPFP